MPTYLIKHPNGAFYPVIVAEEYSFLNPSLNGAFYPVTVAEETSLMKHHDELPNEAIENWEKFKNAHWKHIMKKLGAQ